ncbi:TetR/AcrR family transcriptional regulator [Paraburkholderia bengalensis]|uniref:TetR/AcrR family transcriptional regulator n=1 Tax=Paraburkholderia bengalensis TaxID=2747562 RepID=A0ABU8IQZ1_9BURK
MGEFLMLDRREAILAAARATAQAHGYHGLNFRELADEIGVTNAGIHYYFPSKADLGVELAKRYWMDSSARLEAIWDNASDSLACLREYPKIFRDSLEDDNRMCLCGFMAAEYDDLPESIRNEIRVFASVHTSWLTKVLLRLDPSISHDLAFARAQAIFSAISGAQLMARGQSNVQAFDAAVDSCRAAGLIPT